MPIGRKNTPRSSHTLTIEYILAGKDLSREAVERAVQLSSEKYCPAQAMFAKVAPIDLKITIL
jgi:putative redox protein